jgi:hypothetical protein
VDRQFDDASFAAWFAPYIEKLGDRAPLMYAALWGLLERDAFELVWVGGDPVSADAIALLADFCRTFDGQITFIDDRAEVLAMVRALATGVCAYYELGDPVDTIGNKVRDRVDFIFLDGRSRLIEKLAAFRDYFESGTVVMADPGPGIETMRAMSSQGFDVMHESSWVLFERS